MNFLRKNKKPESVNRKDVDYTDQEKNLFGTSKTKNEEFEKNGFLVVRNIWDPKDLQENIDYDTGHFFYNQFGKCHKSDDEGQVPGSKARHSYPPYKFYHSQIRKKN